MSHCWFLTLFLSFQALWDILVLSVEILSTVLYVVSVRNAFDSCALRPVG
jgi:hypothetical protein